MEIILPLKPFEINDKIIKMSGKYLYNYKFDKIFSYLSFYFPNRILN